MGLSSAWHWLVILLVVFAVFGTKKIRNIGKDLGGAVHDFKKGLNEGTEQETAQQPSESESRDGGRQG